MNNTKTNYILIEDFFPDSLRNCLPINAFLLRKEIGTTKSGFDARSFVTSKFHNTDKYIAGYFYKPISNIL